MIYSLQFKKTGDVFEASTSVTEDAAGKEETRIVAIEVKNDKHTELPHKCGSS